MSLQQSIVEKEYLKCESLDREHVKSLLKWIEKQPHLPNISELQAITFLRRCGYNNEKAKQRIDMYFTIRTMLPEIFMDRNLNDCQVFDVIMITPLPNPTPENQRIVYIKFLDCNFDVCTYPKLYKYLDMIFSLDMYQNGTCIGYFILIDAEQAKLHHFTDPDLLRIKEINRYGKKAMPIKIQKVHVINPPNFVAKILAFYKHLLSSKIEKKLIIHETLDLLYQYIPKNCLPNNYGGTAGEINEICDKARKNLIDNGEFFTNEEKQVTDETKRPGKLKDDSKVFGVEGTFKVLNLD